MSAPSSPSPYAPDVPPDVSEREAAEAELTRCFHDFWRTWAERGEGVLEGLQGMGSEATGVGTGRQERYTDRATMLRFFQTFDLGDDVGIVEAAPQEIGRALVALLGNAFDATRESAEACEAGYTRTVTVSTARTASGAEVRVADNGPGTHRARALPRARRRGAGPRRHAHAPRLLTSLPTP